MVVPRRGKFEKIMCATFFHKHESKAKLDMTSFQNCVTDENLDYLFSSSGNIENSTVNEKYFNLETSYEIKQDQTDSDEG